MHQQRGKQLLIMWTNYLFIAMPSNWSEVLLKALPFCGGSTPEVDVVLYRLLQKQLKSYI